MKPLPLNTVVNNSTCVVVEKLGTKEEEAKKYKLKHKEK